MDAPLSRTSILAYAETEPSPIPYQFSSLTEARSCFDHVLNRVFKYIGQVRSIKNEMDASLENHVHDANGKPFIEPPAAIELRKWIQAYTFTLKTARLRANSQDFVGALTLQIHALTMDISLRQTFFETGIMLLGEQNVYDVFLPDYCELVALAREVSEHPSFVRDFIFDSGIAPCLFLVVTKCRDVMVRRDAIDVMKKATPRREGVWDAHMVARIGHELLRFDKHEEALMMSVNERFKKWVQIHLTCTSTTFMLPAPPGEHDGAVRQGRQYLLGWMERSMKMYIVSEEPRYGIPELACS